MRILITGGAGFVGSNLALGFKAQNAACEVVVLDNLRRRGSELNLPNLKRRGVGFIHGDIRHASDLDDLPGNFDLLIEASAEPSVQAGLDGSPQYVLQTNLTGTLNFAVTENATRFEIADAQTLSGISRQGIAENFATHLPRSFYSATKLASEMMVQEYVDSYGLRAAPAPTFLDNNQTN
ncbi:MAG TPA: NAD-dependent epimerase/dehydratase family protein [Abditibacteriaceae bacterium]|jgi:CDP-paratose 2-epimerase|nr:NAD-dependent epimerase/dehydratase family protein [Abditibacteriaceae bacterium]